MAATLPQKVNTLITIVVYPKRTYNRICGLLQERRAMHMHRMVSRYFIGILIICDSIIACSIIPVWSTLGSSYLVSLLWPLTVALWD